MRKRPTQNLPAKPSDRIPLNIRQALYVAAAILRRIAAKELEKAESCPIISLSQEPYGGKK